jgi:hypothetical protein
MSNTSKTNKKATHSPKFIMDDVKLLFGNLTTPETGVQFNPPSRATPGTIQNNIGTPVTKSWTWANKPDRLAQVVTQDDIGKYGIQTDTNMLFRLGSVETNGVGVWETVQPSTAVTWTWLNTAARTAQLVTNDDLGKTGIQTDINTLYQLTALATTTTPAVWTSIPNPTNTSAPFELSTGASDADSYHDFFRLQIAFQDVWAELLDTRIEKVGPDLYAKFNALMDVGLYHYDDSGGEDRKKRFPIPLVTNDVLTDPLTGKPYDLADADDLQNFVDNLSTFLGIPSDDTSGSVALSQVQAQISQLNDAVLKTLNGCNMLLTEMYLTAGRGYKLGVAPSGHNPPNWLEETNTLGGHNSTDDLTNPPYNDFPSIPRFATDKNSLSDFPASTQRYDVFDSIARELSTLTSQLDGNGKDITVPEITKLLKELGAMLWERYRFDVFAPASINYGLLLNYRQHWVPQSYQVGNLVTTIPLAPQETRRYTTKTVAKKTRNIKEMEAGLRSRKDESSNTWRVDAEIVERAKEQTNFQTNAQGSADIGVYKVQGGMKMDRDHGVDSAETKREFHEAVFKSAQEYRNEHRMEITTEETREDESTSYREIRNPNDELTVTYLFYELQRRYLVDEHLYRATPVVLVANHVPAPEEVDSAWILRHDWIIKRAILDDSFLPALEYLSANYTGENVTLLTLEMAVDHQKSVVDKISQQVQLANQALDNATMGLLAAEKQSVQDLQIGDAQKMVKSFFDPLGIGQVGVGSDGNTDRARVDFAKDTLNRAQTKVNDLVSDLKTETTAFQVAIDKYTAAATKHYGMLADIDRLRLHVKDNIIHYMQAIWSYEPPDQRYFRLYNLDIPVFSHHSKGTVLEKTGWTSATSKMRGAGPSHSVVLDPPTLDPTPKKLHQVADIDNLLGFKGNYMIFPIVDFDNYMAWYLIQPYLNYDATGLTAADPDPLAGLTVPDLQAAMAQIHANDERSFEDHVSDFEEVMFRLLSKQTPEMMIVPSNSLYIEALPGTHPLLEDFKLIHRAEDVKKVQAEVRHAELENLRLAARLANAEYGDPDIDKVVVVGDNKNVTVDAGQ